MLNLQEFNELKTAMQRANTEADKAEGALAEKMKTLKETFGCPTKEEGERKFVMLQKEEQEVEARCDQMLKDLKDKWPKLTT